MLLPEVLGKLAETPELAPAPARGTQSPRVPRDDLDKPHLPGWKARCSRRARASRILDYTGTAAGAAGQGDVFIS